jgi:hypothetical protein
VAKQQLKPGEEDNGGRENGKKRYALKNDQF